MKKKYALCFVFLLFVCAIFSFVGCDNPFIQDVLDDGQNNSNLPIFIDEFSIGDILFSDGTCMKVEDVKLGVTDSQKEKAMAVIAFISEDGRAVGVGLNKKTSANWTKSGSFGETYKFEGLIVKDIKNGDVINFEGDLDGSDNWDYICKLDPEGSADARSNYPAFYYANTYGETYNLSGTEFEKGWYLPAVNEMYEIAYTNRNIVQNSLYAVGGFYFDTGYYSTSSEFWRNPEGIWAVGIDREPAGIFAKHCPSAGAVFVREFDKKSFTKYSQYSLFPTITEIFVPTAGEGYTGEIPVTIIGKNFNGITAGLTGTNFYNDWYVPSAAELYDIIDKIDIVQKSLTAAGGYDLRKDELERAFWSSNSTGFSPYYAVVVRYTDKLVYHDVKFKNAYYANNVMVLRNF